MKHMASLRASETYGQTLHRQADNKTCMASFRASKTHGQNLQRQADNRKRMAGLRASLPRSVLVNSATSTFHCTSEALETFQQHS